MSSVSRKPYTPPTPKKLYNAYSTAGASLQILNNPPPGALMITGGQTPNVLQTILSVTGSGTISYLQVGLSNQNAAGVNMRCQVTLDGVIVFDSTSANTPSNSQGYLYGMDVIGLTTGSTAGGLQMALDTITFQKSMSIAVCSSWNSSNAVNAAVIYKTN